ncbi:MAG: DsbA family protein [Alphaproteobacteria bacterium]|nr:DsbA family protein [Alphaproteobacteria bacterium]
MNSKQTHTHTTHEEHCKCGEHCKCHEKTCCSKFLMPATVLASAILISGSILSVSFAGKKTCPMMAKGKAAIEEKVIRDFVTKNPGVIATTLEKYYNVEQQKAKPSKPSEPAPQAEADKALVDEILNDKTNHVLGNPNGKFVIIEFFDYQCGWCKRTNKEISAVLKDAPNIRWVLIDTPIFGEASEQIARFAMAAGKQGKFKEYHEAIGNAQGKLDKDALIKIGQDLKLNTKRLVADAESQAVKDKMANNQKYARQLNINGVPMLIVDGKINPGALIGERLAEAVAASKAKK